jgi:hypothetical protein
VAEKRRRAMRASNRRWRDTIAWGLAAVLAAGAVNAALAQPGDDPPPREEPRDLEPIDVEGDGLGHEPAPPLGPDGPGDRRFFEPDPAKDWPRIREFLEEHFPEWAGELRRLEVVNQRRFRQRLREIAPRVMRLIHELEQDEELGQLAIEEERLELEIRRALRDYVDASEPAERERIKDELGQMIRRQFEVRQRRGERMVGKTEARLERMRERLEHRAQHADEIIARQLEELLSTPEPDELMGGEDRRDPPRGPRRPRRHP